MELQKQRARIKEAFNDNGLPELSETNEILPPFSLSNLTYLEEAFYFIPVALALQLQRAGQYTAALDWYRTVYDYTVSLDIRKIYYGLKREETYEAGYNRGTLDNWLSAPLDIHKIASTRRNTYTRFTLFSVLRCLLADADAEFTRDTAESLPNARTLYETALELLDTTPELQQYLGNGWHPVCNPAVRNHRNRAGHHGRARRFYVSTGPSQTGGTNGPD